ncbi:hypothetical protein C8R45DRAFT_253508 [Mycena sanguinolenta]|nr:hypothetical protein C8R45DRAFT_253508 [Mycena sanguinolenta]
MRVELPVELEREIFELAASTDVATALRLAVVARRVQAWVEPIIYSTVVVAHAPGFDYQTQYSRNVLRRRVKDSSKAASSNQPPIPRFIRTIPSRPASFFARHVKSLHIGNLSELELLTLLSTCTGISELAWWASKVTPDIAAAFGSIYLRRLSVDSSFSFKDLNFPTLAKITHLDLNFCNYSSPTLPPLGHFPVLTHLSVAYDMAAPPSWRDDVLDSCPRLRIFLLFCDNLFLEELSGLRQRHADIRVVVIQRPVGSWTASWVHDAWPLAESIVRERRELAAAEAADAAASASE